MSRRSHVSSSSSSSIIIRERREINRLVLMGNNYFRLSQQLPRLLVLLLHRSSSHRNPNPHWVTKRNRRSSRKSLEKQLNKQILLQFLHRLSCHCIFLRNCLLRLKGFDLQKKRVKQLIFHEEKRAAWITVKITYCSWNQYWASIVILESIDTQRLTETIITAIRTLFVYHRVFQPDRVQFLPQREMYMLNRPRRI